MKHQPASYNGFAIPPQDTTELSLAILIAEDEEGWTQPIAIASSIKEAKELALSDFVSRSRRLEHGEDPGICPHDYKLWARGVEGEYIVTSSIEAEQL